MKIKSAFRTKIFKIEFYYLSAVLIPLNQDSNIALIEGQDFDTMAWTDGANPAMHQIKGNVKFAMTWDKYVGFNCNRRHIFYCLVWQESPWDQKSQAVNIYIRLILLKVSVQFCKYA